MIMAPSPRDAAMDSIVDELLDLRKLDKARARPTRFTKEVEAIRDSEELKKLLAETPKLLSSRILR